MSSLSDNAARGPELPPASLIVTVLDEAASLPALLASIDAQTVAPDDIVVVDGGSRDNTMELLRSWAAGHPQRRVLQLSGASIAQGRNLAIAHAKHELIAVTDAGVVLDPHWLERLVRALAQDVHADIACGFSVPDVAGPFESAMAASTLPLRHEVDPRRLLPSSRSVAFRRSAVQRVGGYPSWLDYCEDLVLDLALRDADSRFLWVPDAIVRYRPRPSLGAHFRQYFQYARGDGKADLWRTRHAVRYCAYTLGLLAASQLPGRRGPWLLLALGAVLHLRQPVSRLIQLRASAPLPPRRHSQLIPLPALLLLPVIRLVGDTAKMIGYPIGVAWRLTSGDPRAGRAGWLPSRRAAGRRSFPVVGLAEARRGLVSLTLPGRDGDSSDFDVSVVVVSYNAREALGRCLDSLERSEGSLCHEAFVVDNASTDGSADLVQDRFPMVHLIRNPSNVGFAQACNQGLGRAQGRYLLLLNPDTEVGPRALADMVAYMEAHPRAGVAGPRLIRPDGSLDAACRRSFPTPAVALPRMIGLARLFPRSPRFGRYNLTYLDPSVETEVDAVSGAFMMVRREVIANVGPLDDRFFLYGEDLDWPYRIKEQDWQVRYNPAVVVVHRKGESSRQASRSATLAFYRAMHLFYGKHFRRHTHPVLHFSIIAGIHLRLAWSLVRDALRPPRERRVST